MSVCMDLLYTCILEFLAVTRNNHLVCQVTAAVKSQISRILIYFKPKTDMVGENLLLSYTKSRKPFLSPSL